MDGDYCVSKILRIKYLDIEQGMKDTLLELSRKSYYFSESNKIIPICSDYNTFIKRTYELYGDYVLTTYKPKTIYDNDWTNSKYKEKYKNKVDMLGLHERLYRITKEEIRYFQENFQRNTKLI
jgi:hypothetical protein